MTIFEEEIRSQGAIIRARAQEGAHEAAKAAERWRDVTHLLVAARGSSDNAAIFFQYLAGQELGLLVALAAPSLYEGSRQIGLRGAGVLAISQSGRSPGMAQVIAQASAQGCATAALTNDVTSSLAHASDTVIELRAGHERAIASTKTFSTTWHALAQLVEAMRGEPLEGLTVVGRGRGYSVASEIALKVREVTGVRAESYSAPDYLHGPIGADGEDCTVVVVVTDELSDAVLLELLQGCRAAGMASVVILPSTRIAPACDAQIVLPDGGANWVVGLSEVIVGQVIALRLGEVRGRPIDTAPRLAKVTLSA